jgi:hypothetical protein
MSVTLNHNICEDKTKCKEKTNESQQVSTTCKCEGRTHRLKIDRNLLNLKISVKVLEFVVLNIINIGHTLN